MSLPDRMQAQDERSSEAARLLAVAAGAAASARVRIDAAIADLTTPRDTRIAAATCMDLAQLLAAIVVVIEDELRQRLIGLWSGIAPAALLESLAASELPIAAPILDRSRVLGDGELVASLLRRVEAHRLAERMRPADPPTPSIFDTFLESGDEPLATLAMGLLTARSRRQNDLAGGAIGVTDLSAELQYRMVWRIAAALRHYVLERGSVSPVEVDRGLTAAGAAMLAAYDEETSLEGRAMQVARRLHQRRKLDDAVIARAFGEGEVALATALLAARGGIDFSTAWEMIADPEGGRLTLLLRATGVGPRPAALILRELAAAGVGPANLVERMDVFDDLDPLVARDALRLWQADPGYLRAIADVADGLAGANRR
jgi:hypothetical protein